MLPPEGGERFAAVTPVTSKSGGNDGPADLAERDAATRAAAQDHGVPVGEERAALAARELERVAAAPGELDQAPGAAWLGAGDRARGVQVAGAHVGAVDRRVGELLRRRPVEPARVGSRQDGLLAAGRGERDLERDVE